MSEILDIKVLRNPEIISALGDSVRKYGLKEIAARLYKSDKQLYNELNEFGDQGKAKHGLDDAIEITRITRDTTWLEMLVADLGYHLVPKNAEADKETVAEELTDDMTLMGEFSRVCMDPASKKKDIREASRLLRHDIRQTEELAIKLKQMRPHT